MAASKLADYLLDNPLYAIGRQNYLQGSSTAPVQSPLEGLARALQGATGGFFQGQAIHEAKGEQRADQSALAQAMELYASDPVAARSILAQRPNLSDTASALLMNDVGYQRQIDLLKAKDKLEQDAQGRDAQLFGIGAPPSGGGGQAAPNRDQFLATMTPHVQAISQATGLDPRLVMAQTALETGWGAKAPGNNYFGIKGGNGPALPTMEAGPNGTLVPSQASFRSYGDVGGSATDYAKLIGTGAPYASVRDVVKNGGDLAAQIDAMAKSGYATDPQYGAKLRQIAQSLPQQGGFQPSATPAQDVAGGLPQMPAQGSTPQVAPGQPQAPQQAANVPNGDTINFQGVELPKAALASALMIRDAKERQGKITDIVRDAVKKQQGPDAGTTAGDVHILEQVRKDPALAADPSYRAAYNRAAQPQQSQNGQLMYPDMRAYPKPITEQGQAETGVRIEDTPSSRFTMSGKLADDFNQLKPVKDYREVEPIMTSMRDAATRNNRVADLNLVYGLAKIMDPTSVVREGEQVMVRNAQSLPDWLKGMISAANGGSAFPPDQRARILQEAESRVGAYKQQYDAIEKQFVERGQRFGLKREDIVTTPATGQQAPAEPGGARPVYDTNGNRIK